MALVQGDDNSIKNVRDALPGIECGQLISPLCHHRAWPGAFAVDNGAFGGFDRDGFAALLAAELPNKARCLFVAVPDVVGSARRTLELFDHFAPELKRDGWPLALVAQDGQEDLPIPWRFIGAVFIGGTTEWKLGPHAATVIRAAQALGKWVHVGRVNTAQRIEKFLDMGVDSIDGASLSRHGAGYDRDRRRIVATLGHPKLFGTTEGEA